MKKFFNAITGFCQKLFTQIHTFHSPNPSKNSFRPALAMLLCACIIFSATASYLPKTSVLPTDPLKEETPPPSTEALSADESTGAAETEETTAAAQAVEASANPVPYRLNLAYEYPEGSDQSYAEILLRELIRRDSQWYAEIYDMANTAPAKLGRRLGRSAASVLGAYNPASKTQKQNDPSSWSVEHFKNVNISFYDGNGRTSTAVSNAQEILAMASVYAYYNKIEDVDEIRSYINRLWSISHSYSVRMGEVYYCDGCVSTDQRHTDEFEDSELEGEDTFNTDRTINTDISAAVPFARGVLTEQGESPDDIGSESGGMRTENDTRASGTSSHENASIVVPGTETPPVPVNGTSESTTSALQSLAETAESVYIEETGETRKATIVRVETTAAETKRPARETTAHAAESTGESPSEQGDKATMPSEPQTPESVAAVRTARTAVLPAEPQDVGEGAVPETTRRATIVPVETTAAYSRPTAPTQEKPETTAPAKGTEATAPPTTAPQTSAGHTAAAETTAPQTSAGHTATEPAAAPSTTAGHTAAESPAADHADETAASSGQTNAASGQTNAASSAANMVCPGHIDLQITAKIYSLSGENNLYELDPNGAATEGGTWVGWDERCRSYVKHIEREDWVSVYGLNVTVENTSAPLSDAEIASYMKLLPPETSEERKNIIRYALQSVGKVPYYWGGKPSAQNYSGNNFGSVTVPDHRGRILRGLDCSGWVSWVYWSVTGTRPAYEGTEGLRLMGRQVARKDLQPGDIIVITGKTPHVIMFLSWTQNGQIQCIHENGSNNNVTVGVMTANWPYYRNLLD